MRLRTLWTVPSHLVTVGFAAVFLAYADGYLDNRRMLPILAVNLFLYALAALTAPTGLAAAASAETRARLVALYGAQVTVLAPIAFIVTLSLISGVIGAAYLDEGSRYVMYPAYYATVVVLSMLLPFPEHRRRVFRFYLVVAFTVITATVLIDVARPGTFSMLANRAGGFARNPNTAGFLVVTLCCSILNYDRVRLVDLAVLGAAALAVLSTLSRGAAIMFAIVAAGYMFMVVRRSWARGVRFVIVRVASFALLIGGTAVGISFLLDQRMFTAITASSERLGWLRGRADVVGPEDSRIRVAREGWEMVREAPMMTGYGSGFTYILPIGPHNIYLSRWLDNGFPGALAVVWLFGGMAVTFWRRRYTAGLLFTGVVTLEGFFSHNLFEERIFFVLLGVLLTLSYEESLDSVATSPLAPALPSHLARPARPRATGVVTHR